MDNVILVAIVFALMEVLSISCMVYGICLVSYSIYKETKYRKYSDEGFKQLVGCLVILCGLTLWFCTNQSVLVG